MRKRKISVIFVTYFFIFFAGSLVFFAFVSLLSLGVNRPLHWTSVTLDIQLTLDTAYDDQKDAKETDRCQLFECKETCMCSQVLAAGGIQCPVTTYSAHGSSDRHLVEDPK